MTTQVQETNKTQFSELGISESLLEALNKAGYIDATEIQANALPILFNENCDIIAQAQTGTGKTLAFGLYLLDVIQDDFKDTNTLILAPTRELALQVATELERFNIKKSAGFNVISVYGGQSFEKQLSEIRRGATIIVGTPGRIKDHIKRGTLKLKNIKHFVLDEADEMLNMGFLEEIEEILKSLPSDKRTMLFSATMPSEILDIVNRYLKPQYKMIKTTAKTVARNEIEQICYKVSGRDRLEVLFRVLDFEKDFYGIVFSNTKSESDELSAALKERGFGVEVIHGDIEQGTREKVLATFKKKHSTILVATDVAARGIDVQNLTHVINFGLPQDPESYVHRIGRTGRAGKSGKAITIISMADMRKLENIKRISKCEIKMSEVPSINEILKNKETTIKDRFLHGINHEEVVEKYQEIADELCEVAHGDSMKVLAIILKKIFEKDLDPTRYREIQAPRDFREPRPDRGNRERSGDRYERGGERGGDRYERGGERRYESSGADETKLFFAQGKSHGMGKREIVDAICSTARVKSKDILNIKLLDNMSFIIVNSAYANDIVTAFAARAKRDGGRSIVSFAKDKE